MAIVQIYRGEIASGNDVSSEIIGMTEIRYGINPDFSFELPEVTLTTHKTGWNVGDRVTVVDEKDASKRVAFYVEEINYDYATRRFSLRCPHVLAKLADIPVTKWLEGDWNDNMPAGLSAGVYEYWNNQSVIAQGNIAYRRQYCQVGLWIAMAIYHVGGVESVLDVDIHTLNNKDSFYTDGATVLKYRELAVNIQAVWRCGERSNVEWDDPSFDVQNSVTSCLDYLKFLCSALHCTIDIFRSNYRLNTLEMAAAPTDTATLARTDQFLPLYQKICMSRAGLDPDCELLPFSADWIFGYYDDLNRLVEYEYGVDDPEIEIVESYDEWDNPQATEPGQLYVTFPMNFRLYRINLNTTPTFEYRSYITMIETNAAEPKAEFMQWVPAMADFWGERAQKNEYETAFGGLDMKWPLSRFDIPRRRQRFERWL